MLAKSRLNANLLRISAVLLVEISSLHRVKHVTLNFYIDKEKILSEILDPLSFWREFYSSFQYRIEETSYYSLLKSVNQRADRRKKKMCEIFDDICNILDTFPIIYIPYSNIIIIKGYSH